LKIPPEIKH